MENNEKRLNLLNDERQRLNVFHLEEVKPLFADRMDLPSGRVYQGEAGERTLAGLRYIEKECNCSWYRVIRNMWNDYLDKEAIFYRGNSIDAKTMFQKAEEFSRALLAAGVEKGDEIACCVSNVPELLYIMFGANRIGVKLNFFASHYDPVYIRTILKDSSHKLFLATDDEFGNIADLVEEAKFDYIVLISLADSLPEHPEQCAEYEPDLAEYYYFPNLAVKYARRYPNITLFADFLNLGKQYTREIVETSTLDTDFLITYTSGSTNIGFPKRMYFTNRTLITIGVFHDPKWCGNPSAHCMRAMALIHTDSNTNLVTSISDSMFQICSIAMEPHYAREDFLDVLFLNKPHIGIATTNFWLEASRQYLIEKRFHDANGKGRVLGPCAFLMAVGEACSPGEERFINAFLKESLAGSALNIPHLPYVTIGLGGGDTEHGGIYYTLMHGLNQQLFAKQLQGRPYGLKPVPFAQVTCLKKAADGTLYECGYNEYGIIVANCATVMSGYKHYEKVKSKIVTDYDGIDWLSCDVFGYIDNLGTVHVKDRSDSVVTLENGAKVLPFQIADVVQEDAENILTTLITTGEDEGKTKFIINLEFSPLKKKYEREIIEEVDARLKAEFPELADRFLYRKFDYEHPFPLTGSGKRSAVEVKKIGTAYAYRYRNGKMFQAGV